MLFEVILKTGFRPQRVQIQGTTVLLSFSCPIFFIFHCFKLILTDVNLDITPFFSFFFYFLTRQVFLKRAPVACVVAAPEEKCEPAEFRPLGLF